MESILTSVKKLLGIAEEYEHFDPDLIMHINSVFMILNQMGVGPKEGFSIIDESDLWTDFIPTEDKRFESVKTYMNWKVRLMFDPPTSSVVMSSAEKILAELEWRMNVASETT